MKKAFVLALLLACKKDAPTKTEPNATASAAISAAPSSSHGGGKNKNHREDRHDDAEPAKLSLDVTIGGEKKTWGKEAFDHTPRVVGSKANDGDDRDTWSLRDLALVNGGPTARVTAVVGDKKVPIDQAAWKDPNRTPIVHTTRRGTMKFRWTDKDGKWGDAEVSDVTGLEVAK